MYNGVTETERIDGRYYAIDFTLKEIKNSACMNGLTVKQTRLSGQVLLR